MRFCSIRLTRFNAINTVISRTMSLASLPGADIDPEGKFKYVLIKVQNGNEECYLVRGYKFASYHADVYEHCEEKELQPLKKQIGGLEWECVGGGRILHKPDEKYIKVYGYSMGFGLANHSISCKLLEKKYPDYTTIEWSNDGY